MRTCDPAMGSSTVAFVLKGHPRLSETFIAQEILALEERGLEILIVSLRQPTDTARHPIHDELRAKVLYLPEFPSRDPLRVLKTLWRGRRRQGYRAARALWLKDLRRDPSMLRIRSFLQALVLAEELPVGISRLHAHYIHTPASVTRYAARLRGLPWSCSAHARDIWTSPEWEKREKLAELDWLVTCTAHGARHLASLAPASGRVELVYHGLDFSRFPPPDRVASTRSGSRKTAPVVLMSVGRAVEKKGYGYLLEALARLPEDLHWRFVHIGYGPLLVELQRKAKALGLDGRVTWMGAQPQDRVIETYREADLFVLANCVAGDGDMDGLPNVMMEAQSQGLACLSTELSAIPELIEDGVTGMLVPPQDVEALTAALERLIRNPALRARLGSAGARRVRTRFSHEQGIDLLARRFGLATARSRLLA